MSIEAEIVTAEGTDDLAVLHAAAFSAPWSGAEFADLLGQDGIHAIREGQGFIMIRVVLDEAEIITLAVHPDARRLGLGRKLVERGAAAAVAGGATRMFLEVAEDNEAAIILYERSAFERVGKRKGYYNGGRTAAIVMARELNPAPTTI